MLLINDPSNRLHLTEKPLSPPLQPPSDITWKAFTNKNKRTTNPSHPTPSIHNFGSEYPTLPLQTPTKPSNQPLKQPNPAETPNKALAYIHKQYAPPKATLLPPSKQSSKPIYNLYYLPKPLPLSLQSTSYSKY